MIDETCWVACVKVIHRRVRSSRRPQALCRDFLARQLHDNVSTSKLRDDMSMLPWVNSPGFPDPWFQLLAALLTLSGVLLLQHRRPDSWCSDPLAAMLEQQHPEALAPMLRKR